MARLIYFILLFMCPILQTFQTIRHGFRPEYLTMYSGDEISNNILKINRGEGNIFENSIREKRDLLKSASKGTAVSTPKTTNLNSDNNPRNISTVVCIFYNL